MKPKWLVWPRKYAHSSFSSLVQSLLPKYTLLRTYFTPNRPKGTKYSFIKS